MKSQSTLRLPCSPLPRLRHRRKTRYGRVANPFPTGTFTPQDTLRMAVAGPGPGTSASKSAGLGIPLCPPNPMRKTLFVSGRWATTIEPPNRLFSASTISREAFFGSSSMTDVPCSGRCHGSSLNRCAPTPSCRRLFARLTAGPRTRGFFSICAVPPGRYVSTNSGFRSPPRRPSPCGSSRPREAPHGRARPHRAGHRKSSCSARAAVPILSPTNQRKGFPVLVRTPCRVARVRLSKRLTCRASP